MDFASLLASFDFIPFTQLEDVQLNITEFDEKPLIGLVNVSKKEEVVDLVTLANTYKISLYPYSSGMNWGQGSKIPTFSNVLLVDLSAMNKIIEVNTTHRYAIIEAGVTQLQLFEALRGTSLKLPVTGSAKNSSVVGNMLERGATFFGHRNKLLMGVEAVLGNGEIIRTGLWHFYQNNDAIFYHSEGVGANLNGLFTQSNFGIVTKIIVRLLPQKEGFLLHVEAKEDAIIPLVDTFYSLWEQGVTQDGVLITNKNDPRTTTKGNYTYSGDWFAVSSIAGATPTITQALVEEARKRLEPYCYAINFLSTESEETTSHPYFSVLNKLYHGEPTDYSLLTMAQMQNLEITNAKELDTNKEMIGFSVALPAVSFDGNQVWKVIQIVKKVSDEIGVQAFHNFASINDKVFEGFYRIYFDRNDSSAIFKAHEWNEKVHLALEQHNILPYRINIERMAHFVGRKDDTFWQNIKRIKNVLDPNNIIAVGRYAPN